MASLLVLQCPYHGWEYTGSGQCVAMPSTTPCPGVRVESLACSEQDGFVWVFPGDEAAMPAELPALAQPPQGYVIHAEIEVRLGHPTWCLHQPLAVCTSELASLPTPGCISLCARGPCELQQLDIPRPYGLAAQLAPWSTAVHAASSRLSAMFTVAAQRSLPSRLLL